MKIQKQTHVETIEHTDVRGNKLKYLKISTATQIVLINIGQKTWDAVESLNDPEENNNQTKLPLDEKTNEPTPKTTKR